MKIGIICTSIYQKAPDYKELLLNSGDLFLEVEELSAEEIEDRVDMFVVLGGDGFMLKTLHKYYRYNKPFCGINFGNLGFLLNDVSCFRIENILDDIKSCRIYKINPLTVEFINIEKDRQSTIAINEAVAFRQLYKITDLDVYIDGKKRLENYGGDGIILSTPTGSCAYNYSAGGVILPPNSQNLILTAVAPIRRSNFRSVLLENTSVIEFKNNNDVARGINLFCDCFEFSGVSTFKAYSDKNIEINLLFHPSKPIEEKTIEEQFK